MEDSHLLIKHYVLKLLKLLVIQTMMDINHGLYIFDKKSSVKGVFQTMIADAATLKPYKKLTNELYKPIIIKFQKRKVYLCFMDNIQGC